MNRLTKQFRSSATLGRMKARLCAFVALKQAPPSSVQPPSQRVNTKKKCVGDKEVRLPALGANAIGGGEKITSG
jgi:hypothetical protein